MTEGFRKGSVFVRGRFAGMLRETDAGYEFVYDREYLDGSHPLAVNLTLPLSEEPFFSPVLFPFFDGLIPEGWLLDIASRNWKLACRTLPFAISVSRGKRARRRYLWSKRFPFPTI